MQSLKTRITLTTLAIFLISLWSLSFYASRMLRMDMERLLGEQQFSSVSYMAARLDRDLQERLDSLKAVADTIDTTTLSTTRAMQAMLVERPLLHTHFNGGVIAYRRDGTAIAEVPTSAGRVGTNYMDIDTIAAALRDGQSTIGKPVMGKKLQAPVFGMTVPIRNAQGAIVGALSGVTNLGKPNFLDGVTDSRYGKTGGYMLVAPQYRMVVTATDKSRSMETLPNPGVNPVVDRFAQGYEGSGTGVNPLGVGILAAAKGVPVAGWYLAVAMPTAEAFAPIEDMKQRMLLATVLLTVLAGGLTWWMLKRQLAPMLVAARTLATLSSNAQFPKSLAVTRPDEIGQLIGGFNHLLQTLEQRDEALVRNERQYSEILENVDTYIYLKDVHGRYLFANRSAREFFGATQDSVVGKSDEDFFDAQTVAQLRANDQIVLEMGTPINKDETNLCLLTGRTSTHLSVKIPLRNAAGEVYALCGISTDITERSRAEQETRVAAIAFECQEGIVVMDADLKILRVNQAFTRITGFTEQEARGQTTAILRSDRHPAAFYDGIWSDVRRTGAWQGEMWHRRKNGEDYPEHVTITAVLDAKGRVTHYVGNLTDATSRHLQEQQRVLGEIAHRGILVREVHHRIKNNLQGITGILRQFAKKHPETAETINQAIGQVQGISVIHGLQGRAVTASVRLCELTGAISEEVQSLWQTPVAFQVPDGWQPCVLAESEAVPIALVLNELILNAVKHRDKTLGNVHIALQKGLRPDIVQVRIHNPGLFAGGHVGASGPHSGLQLIAALMPRHGATLAREQQGDMVITMLELASPVISLDSMESP